MDKEYDFWQIRESNEDSPILQPEENSGGKNGIEWQLYHLNLTLVTIGEILVDVLNKKLK